MRKSWEKLVQHVCTKYAQDISNDLNRKLQVNLVMPVHSTKVLVRHATRKALVSPCQEKKSTIRAAATADPLDTELPTKIEILDNKIFKWYYYLTNKIPIEMSKSDNSSYGNEWRTHQESNVNLENHRFQAYLLILGELTQLLQDKMKHHMAWNATSTLYNPLSLLQLIWENGIGTDRVPVSVCNRLRPGTYLIRISPSLNDQSTVIWEFQHIGWCLWVHWSNLTT